MSKLALALGVLIAVLHLGSDGVQARTAPVEEERLRVEIHYSYLQPPDFNLDPPYFRVASSITLLCVVSGSAGQVSYNWSSDCSGNCFVKGKITESVSTLILLPSDSGIHTCTARDFVGVDCIRNASASIDMRIVGAGIFDENTATSLANNGIIAISVYERLHISCWFSNGSDSTAQFIGPDGMSASGGASPFTVTTSTSNHSTVMQIITTAALYEFYQGVYTCRVYGEAGLTELNIGIYVWPFSDTQVARVVSLKQDTSNDTFTLICVTTNSPPTNLLWTKDGVPLSVNGTTHTLTQTILDRSQSIYRNVLVIEDSIDRLPGEYSCAVENIFGTSDKETMIGNVIKIHGHEHILIVGRMAYLNCSTHLKSHIKLQWLLGGFEVPLETSTAQSVVLSLDLESAGLNGAMFTCRITTYDGVYDETITLKVKEFENIVTITEQPMPVMAGETLVLNCLVRSDDPSIAQWLDPNGVSIINDGFMFVDGPFIDGNKTTLSLYFSPLHTSHAGAYVCHSNVTQSESVETASHSVTVQIPAPTVSISQSPPDNLVYTSSVLTLNCTIKVHEAVDTGIEVDGSFSGPEGVLLTNSRTTVSDVIGSKPIYHKVAVLSSLRSSDTGIYQCIATLRPNLQSGLITASDERVVDANITVALNISIVIDYTPSTDVNFGPPNYRPGTSVTLTCNVFGATEPVSYRWSSTSPCADNGCFASSSTSSSVSSSTLYWYDAGRHTCTVSDGDGNYGSSTSEMDIIGAGFYVESGNPYGAVPNNSVVIARYRSGYYINIYCITNSSAYMHSGSLTYTSRYRDVYFDSGYSPGVARIYSYASYPNSGIYTAHVMDANGAPLELNIGIYNYRFTSPPRVTALRQFLSTDDFTLECTSTTSAATFVTWVKDGVNLTMDGRVYKQVQKVTSRTSSTYQNLLFIDDNPNNLPGVYTCVVSNMLGTSNQIITFHGLEVHGHENLTVGQPANISCSSDLGITNITWFNNDMIPVVESTISRVDLLFQQLTTSSHGERYTCRATSPHGTQETVVTISAQIPDAWGIIAANTYGTPTEGQEFNLICNVTFIGGLPQDSISVTWLDANGNGFYGNEIIEISPLSVDNATVTSVLTFKRLNSSHGGVYTCKASVNVPGLNIPPPLSLEYDLIVTSISLFQLKFGPVQYCVHWTEDRTWLVALSIQSALTAAIQDRCNCELSPSSIDYGEFSCQTTTTEVIYRNKIRGTSNTFTASELLTFVEDWIIDEGTFAYGVFRLRISTECPLRIQSFHQPECAGDTTTMPVGCFDNFLASVCAKQSC